MSESHDYETYVQGLKKGDVKLSFEDWLKSKNENKGTALDIQLRAKLTNTAWQKGLTWRNEKVQAVAEARRRGVREKEIFRQLKRAGLVDSTANAIMNDAYYLEE